jgi:farnesyl-diphosphate farnesyltransferase
LSIPLLPEPSRREVTLAYLLLRIADTLEDGIYLPPDSRHDALQQLLSVVTTGKIRDAEVWSRSWVGTQPIDNPDYLELLGRFPDVLRHIGELSVVSRQIITQHAQQTIVGMQQTLQQMDDAGVLRLETTTQLRQYCYVVAGIVGEMLTELFLTHWPSLHSRADRLRQTAKYFGEGLQLVNILKDADADAGVGRFFLPPQTSLEDMFRLARDDLRQAHQYIQVLQEAAAPQGVIAFARLPVELAEGTLARVEQGGPGSKLSRAEVRAVLLAVTKAN